MLLSIAVPSDPHARLVLKNAGIDESVEKPQNVENLGVVSLSHLHRRLTSLFICMYIYRPRRFVPRNPF
jgi:hypothetical protein